MRETLVAGAIIVALSGLFGYYKIYLLHESQRTEALAQIQAEQARQNAQAEVAVILGEIERLRKPLAPAPETSWLVNELVKLADEADVQLKTISPAAPKRNKRFTQLSVNLQFSASYHELGTFLDSIERSPSFFRIDRLDVSASAQASGQQTAVIKLVVSTLYDPPPLES